MKVLELKHVDEHLKDYLRAQGLTEAQADRLIHDYRSSGIGRLASPKMKAPPPRVQPSNAEETLRSVLQQDLGFKGKETTYATHNIHAFAAKFPPQLPQLFIERLTEPGEVVLDPMVGSGTTLIEALLLGRVGIGFDLDPLAIRISRAKVTKLDPHRILQAGYEMLQKARELVESRFFDPEAEICTRYSGKVVDFLHYWFTDGTRRELLALLIALEQCTSSLICNLLTVLFSSIIITKSGGVSLARDLAHSRPHRDPEKQPKSALAAFHEKLTKVARDYEALRKAPGRAFAFHGDARALPMRDATVDLIVTSPPYANAIDYVRAHKFSLFWLGYTVEELQALRREAIGAEVSEEASLSSPTIHETIQAVREKDPRKAGILAHYFQGMEAAIREMYRVLRPGKAAIIVVGPSTTRGIHVPTPQALAEIGESIGFRCVGIKEREIDRDKRLMPWSHARGETGIEARIHEEHVIALLKPSGESSRAQ